MRKERRSKEEVDKCQIVDVNVQDLEETLKNIKTVNEDNVEPEMIKWMGNEEERLGK